MTVRSMRAATRRSEDVQVLCKRREPAGTPSEPVNGGRPPIGAEALALARAIYAGRRRRERFLAADLFGEPTWDILLDLFIAAGEGRRVPTTSACIGANVPPTTALRWLRILETRGLVEREDDGRDGRRTFVCLTARGTAAMSDLMVNCQGTLGSLKPTAADQARATGTPAFDHAAVV
jgi:predicted transcriptional regulator